MTKYQMEDMRDPFETFSNTLMSSTFLASSASSSGKTFSWNHFLNLWAISSPSILFLVVSQRTLKCQEEDDQRQPKRKDENVFFFDEDDQDQEDQEDQDKRKVLEGL